MVRSKLRRSLYAFSAGVLAAAALAPTLLESTAHAYGLVASRSIQMSSSANGSLTAGQDVTYKVKFNIATDTTDVGGILVEFCSNTPIIGDSCTAPTGFNVNEGSVALTQVAGISGFSIDAATTANKLIIVNASADNPAANETYEFDLGTVAASDGVTNPTTSPNTTFYARIVTYDTLANAQSGSSATAGGGTGAVDAGGIALSTANQITVTSKVQERLTFCMYTSAANYTDCTGATGTNVTLGDTNGVLDSAGPYVDKNTKWNVATNASQGAAIRVKGTTLSAGAFTIAPIGGTAAASSTGSEQFGFCTYVDPGSTVTSGITLAAPYDNANCSTTSQTAGTGSFGGNGTAQFGFDTANTNTTYGQTFATKAAGGMTTGIIPFIGNISDTTEAGIYTTTLTFIATGIY